MCVPDQVCFSVCVCVKPLAESSYLRVISQSPEFDTMRSAELRRRHTLLFQATHVHSYTHTGIRWKHGRERDSGAPPHGRRQVFWPSLVSSIAQKLTEPQPLLLTTMCILLNPGDGSTVSSHFPQRCHISFLFNSWSELRSPRWGVILQYRTADQDEWWRPVRLLRKVGSHCQNMTNQRLHLDYAL